jgi:hypothetical protein
MRVDLKDEANQVCDYTKNSEDHEFAEKKSELVEKVSAELER